MAIKQRPDSPTNNFATWNELDKYASTLNLSEGNLRVYSDQATWWDAYTTISMSQSGKYYCEIYALSDAVQHCFGVCTTSAIDNLGTNNGGVTYHTNFSSGASYYYSGGGNIVSNVNGVQNTVSSGTLLSNSTNDIVGILLDLDNDTVKFYIDNSLIGTTSSIISGNYVVFYNYQMNNNQSGVVANFGQDPTFAGNKTSGSADAPDANGIGAFYYDPTAIDSEALALCTANLPEMTPTVNDDVPKDYFKALTYTGSYPTANSVNVGFNPDLIWLKSRTQPYNHGVWDTIRTTVNGYEFLSTSNTNAEGTSGDAISFITNGFRVDIGQAYNEGGQGDDNMVAWCWKAGGTPTGGFTGTEAMVDGVETTCSALATSASASITPTAMSVNTDAGFSIVKYQGILDGSISTATIPHGLASADFCIIKNLDNPNTWVVSHTSITPNVMALQDTGAAASTPPVDANYGQITSLNSNTVTITRGSTRGDNVGENLNSWGYIMYCWHSVEGFSKFGSYKGNGSTDGPFVHCGFRPSFIIMKVTGTGDWQIYDSARDPYNVSTQSLYANGPYQEDSNVTNRAVDILSNGFKIRSGQSYLNSGNFIFMAFAEQPFNYANAR